MQIIHSRVGAGAVVVVLGFGFVHASAASADPTIAGTYNPVAVHRLVDTRIGLGAPKAALGAHKTLSFNATSSLGRRSVAAVALTITAIHEKAVGSLTVYSGTTRPATSTVNFKVGEPTPNAAIIDTHASGIVKIYNGSSGTVDVAADLAGYWTGGHVTTAGAVKTVAPTRLVDSRVSPGKPLAARQSVSVRAAGKAGVPSDATAVAVNVAAVAATRSGYLSATASSTDQTSDSRTSTVNFSARTNRATLAFVPLNSDGTISLYNGSTGPLNYVVDLSGFVTAGTPSADGSVVPNTPYRAADSRVDGKPVPAGGDRVVTLFPDGTPADLFKAVIVHVTAVDAPGSGYFTAWDGTGNPRATSVTNFRDAAARTGTAIVPVNTDGSISIHDTAAGPVEVVVDVQGFVLNDLSGMSPAQASAKVKTALRQGRTYSAKHVSS